VSHIKELFTTLKFHGITIISGFSLLQALSLSFDPYLYNFLRYVLGLNIALLGIYESLSTILSAASQPVSGYVINVLGSVKAFKLGVILDSLLHLLAIIFGYYKYTNYTCSSSFACNNN